MVDSRPIRSYNSKFPKPEPELDEEAVQDAMVDVVLNVYRERKDAHSIALRLSFRLPPDKA